MELGIVDEVIDEPIGGAHRDNKENGNKIKKSILKNLEILKNYPEMKFLIKEKQNFLKSEEIKVSKSTTILIKN